MNRPLFVFAGQSNMMGASVYEASKQIFYNNSFEYLHKPKRLGDKSGEFKQYAFPTGEFSYIDLKKAYNSPYFKSETSTLDKYSENTYFCPAMNNLKDAKTKTLYPFDYFSESTLTNAPSPAPYIVALLEEKGYNCAYTHIAKGGISIAYYLEGNSASYFDMKASDFFDDCKTKFKKENINEKILVWLQGESDCDMGYSQYKASLFSLWNKCKKLGFTKFFIIRVGFWGDKRILEIMKAQEDFCQECKNAFIITRVCSFMKYFGQKEDEFFCSRIEEEFLLCRDSFYGFDNQHINEKGFKTIAKYAVPNIIRILFERKNPILEREHINFLYTLSI